MLSIIQQVNSNKLNPLKSVISEHHMFVMETTCTATVNEF